MNSPKSALYVHIAFAYIKSGDSIFDGWITHYRRKHFVLKCYQVISVAVSDKQSLTPYLYS